jgi:hypothetical protein
MKGWIFYPLWGLELEENGFGLEKPIFGDATLVTRNFIVARSPSNPIAANVLSGGGLKSMLKASGADFAGPAPIERLIDIPPDSFIAVRRANPNDGAKYAESIRALFTSSAVLTSGVAKGFAMTPLALHWAAIPARVMLDGNGLPQTRYSVAVSNFIHLTPLRVTHKSLREAWQTGTAIQGTWRMFKDDVLSKALVGDWSSLSGLRKRIRSCASTLARAMDSSDMTLSTLHAVAALEMLLKDGKADFREMEEMATAIFEGPNGPPEMQRLFRYRHQIAHEAGNERTTKNTHSKWRPPGSQCAIPRNSADWESPNATSLSKMSAESVPLARS